MASRFVLWSEQDCDLYRVGGKPLVFPSSQAATDHLNASQAFREDYAVRPWTTKRTWDILTVTVS